MAVAVAAPAKDAELLFLFFAFFVAAVGGLSIGLALSEGACLASPVPPHSADVALCVE